MFVCGYSPHEQPHISTFFELCYLTGGNGFYYPISTIPKKFHYDLKANLEKLHFDLTHIIIRKEYKEVHFMIRTSEELEVVEMLGAITRNGNDPIYLPSCSQDFNIIYHIKPKRWLKEDNKYYVQFVCAFTDHNDIKYKRVLNYAFIATQDMHKVFGGLDIDTVTKLILCKELANSLSFWNKHVSAFEKIGVNIKTYLIELLFYYKREVTIIFILFFSVQHILPFHN
jgi:hypothetical protein